MQAFAFGCLLAYVLVSAVISTRLLLRWRRNREAPELLLGLGLLCSVSIGYPLIVWGSSLPETGAAASRAGMLAFQVGVGLYAHFNARVFRPGETWAKVLASVCTHIFAVVFVVVVTLPAALDTPEAMAQHLFPFGVLNQVTLLVICAWTGFEGLRYHLMLRRRLAVGMAEPLLVDRFRLFGILGCLQTSTMVVGLAVMLSGENVATHNLVILWSSLQGLLSSVLTVLIFMPPTWYVGRFAGATPQHA